MESRNNRHYVLITAVALLLTLAFSVVAFAEGEEEYVPSLYGKWQAMLPPLIAIILALLTKEVYSSLFIGILVGGVLYAGADLDGVLNHVFVDGIIGSLSDAYNVGILVFLVILGVFVSMMNKTGGSAAFGRWAAGKIHSRAMAQGSTVGLGLLIFIDDYFNCLTVGSVMRPLTDEYKVSRAKLAYLIDATAAPVCIIAPISSWAAAVSGFVEGQNGFTVFLKAIPYNFYALFTIAMMIALIAMKFDYGPMAKYERMALQEGNLMGTCEQQTSQEESLPDSLPSNSKVADLVFPVIILIISCVIGMIYSGGFFDGESFKNAFANCDASVGLVLGSSTALVITILYYMVRRVIPFGECMACLPDGFKQMVSPILILTLAWTLKTMTDSLGLKAFVEASLGDGKGIGIMLLPMVIFLIACVLAFASGTSWGTFGLLIPIALVATEKNPEFMMMAISACMAGAVCGDHCSPISDTTIMSSAGARCNHLTHVQTQLPYAITVAVVSAVTYLLGGILLRFTSFPLLSLPIGLVMMIGTLFIIKKMKGKETAIAPTK